MLVILEAGPEGRSGDPSSTSSGASGAHRPSGRAGPRAASSVCHWPRAWHRLAGTEQTDGILYEATDLFNLGREENLMSQRSKGRRLHRKPSLAEPAGAASPAWPGPVSQHLSQVPPFSSPRAAASGAPEDALCPQAGGRGRGLPQPSHYPIIARSSKRPVLLCKVTPKSTCCSPHPKYLRIWPHLDTESQ